MTLEEKEQLVALLVDSRHWCRGAEARNAEGQAVVYSDGAATAWDLTGAACHLFGWRRARELFEQIERQRHGCGSGAGTRGDSEIAAMVALQNWNDDPQTTHVELMSWLQSLAVHAAPGCAPAEASGEPVSEGRQR